ncbi:T9SS type B sorting domain-containing protein [Aegicerativicinus sediminis]|uniref:T9SS type B sorting domain-containing protein n=1 Tax=Aegicerativicinus sediminis TaxID=2893202 RepID=UPI001E3AA21E|nr:T9SS type B sorting domain-containing protein [Aegicerativicinus sediminis]
MKFSGYTYPFIIPLLLFLLHSHFGLAQLGFCPGNSGDPIFFEDFGTGTANGPPLGSDITSYRFDEIQPNDGEYTISANTQYFGWHDTDDHTPGDVNGRSLIVNADYTAGEFYRSTVTGLCENTSYEFSSWLLNLSSPNECGGSTIPINVRFEIWDDTDTILLARGDTGSISSSSTPNWQQYALVFQTELAQTAVILKMINNGNGGCGNDLAIDDITFKSCGDLVIVEDNEGYEERSYCEIELPTTVTLEAIPDFSVYEDHYYQWQISYDGVSFSNIANEIDNTLAVTVDNTAYYRAVISEDPINLNDPDCVSFSDVFKVTVYNIPSPPNSLGNVEICEDGSGNLQVSVPSEVSVNWYDAAIGGNLLQENSPNYSPTNSGIYYAEAYIDGITCISSDRTPITYTIRERPDLFNEEGGLCSGETMMLSADFPNATYQWNTGATTESIEISNGGSYSVIVTNIYGCDSTKYFEIEEIPSPLIETITSDGPAIVVEMATNGDFEYSLNGFNYQLFNRFNEAAGGLYTIYVRELNGCGIDTMQHHHFVIPKFFTPNNDGRNDSFNLRGIEYFQSSSVQLFDRYGNLIKTARNGPFVWDGTKDSRELPSSDYWYIIIIEGQEIKGHVSLRR